MSAIGPILALIAILVGLAFAGPFLLRRAFPILVRFPRFSTGLLPGVVIMWLVGVLSIGPLLAWLTTGPALLPTGLAGVCQRCIAAANPFSADRLATVIPTVLLFAIPAGLVAILLAGFRHQRRTRIRKMAVTAGVMTTGGENELLRGYDVTVVPDDRVCAFSLPGAYGGIVLSRGALEVLAEDELAAVLAHEHAHVRHKHHHVHLVMDSLVSLVGWVPLVRECGRVLPSFLEIAADRHAQRTVGTGAVVSALVTLGERRPAEAGLLHMAGPERVRQLIAPVQGGEGALSAAALALHMVMLVGLTVMVASPYGSALITGCL